MIKLIIFDLDGVLIDAKEIHYTALNQAILDVTNNNNYIITLEEHLSLYDGKKTSEKLQLLSTFKKMPESFHKLIWERKQYLTSSALKNIVVDKRLQSMMQNLRDRNYLIACCSNSIRKSVFMMLSKLGLIEYMDLIISNEDVKNSKPHPEMYWKCMSNMNVIPDETLIIEDSPTGLAAAFRSGAKYLRVSDTKDLTIDKINDILNDQNSYRIPKWQNNNMNILIPMAGAGTRFQQQGYTFPKPLIDVNGKPMIQVVVENLNIDANFIYIVQKQHREKYNLDTLLKLITPKCEIVEVDGLTEGAACTSLAAKKYIDNDQPLLIANSDQFVEWNSNEFMYKMSEQDIDGGIVTFNATHPKWSFVKIDEKGFVTQVAEKNPISNIATAGIYYWKKGLDYVKYAERMINKNIRVNNEFYICPVYNEAIIDTKKIKTFDIQKMWGLGTPEDLQIFLNNKL